jgi:uncharacterized protein
LIELKRAFQLMPTEPEEIRVQVTDSDSTTALLYLAPRKKRAATTVLLGHGAGADQTSVFMRLFASGLCERGLDAMTFNFLYMEQGRRVPDAAPKLEACFRAVIQAAAGHGKLKGNRLILGGKSMGGRIATQVAAQEENGFALPSSLAGLVLLGYPLHPPGKPEKMRDAHLKSIPFPMLFIQGSRDAFGLPEELRSVIERQVLSATLEVVAGGDHSFKVPKTSPLTQQDVYRRAMDLIAEWSQRNTK